MDCEKHPPKIRETIVRVKGREYPRVIVDFGMIDGKRERKTFKAMAQAERAVDKWNGEQKILAKRIGEGAQRFLTGDVQDAATAMNILGPAVTLAEAATAFQTLREAKVTAGEAAAVCRALRNAGLPLPHVQDAAEGLKVLTGKTTLAAAAAFYMERHFPEGGDRTANQLVEDYIESRKQVDRREATIRDIRARLGRGEPAKVERTGAGTLHLKPTGFAHDFAGVPVAHITTADLERWMERNVKGKSRTTWRGMRVHLVGLFNFAKGRKYIRENPAEPLMTPKTSKSAKARPYVMPVEDVEKVMLAAATHEPETVPYFALCLFAGIRPQGEIGRLTWADINIERREIDIRADTSKTGDERFIEMSENLVSWLLPHRRAAGPICGARAAVESVREKAGVRWEADCMRHSFASYHLAQHDNAGKTALQMGHRTLGMLFEHYRRAVRKEDALAFWAIRPEGVPAVVELRANAG